MIENTEQWDIAYSIGNVPIRLTHERWFHIVENHDEMAGHYDSVLSVVEDPEFILRGLMADPLSLHVVTGRVDI